MQKGDVGVRLQQVLMDVQHRSLGTVDAHLQEVYPLALQVAKSVLDSGLPLLNQRPTVVLMLSLGCVAKKFDLLEGGGECLENPTRCRRTSNLFSQMLVL